MWTGAFSGTHTSMTYILMFFAESFLSHSHCLPLPYRSMWFIYFCSIHCLLIIYIQLFVPDTYAFTCFCTYPCIMFLMFDLFGEFVLFVVFVLFWVFFVFILFCVCFCLFFLGCINKVSYSFGLAFSLSLCFFISPISEIIKSRGLSGFWYMMAAVMLCTHTDPHY